MADEDDTKPELQRAQFLAAVDALYQALAAVGQECARLEIATQKRDPGAAELAASEAVASLVVAKVSLGRFNLRGNRADSVLAQVATGAAHRAVIDHFTRAATAIDSPPVQRLLLRLRLGLALAYGEPPPRH